MTLRNLTIPKAVISVGDEVFAVSGITAAQAFSLVRRHREELTGLFENLAGRGTVEAGDVLNSIEGIVSMFPDLVAEAIVLASGVAPDSPDLEEEIAVARQLPFPVQADALLKIGELTFTQDMPPKKFFALLAGMVQQLSVTKTSEAGSDN